MVFKVVSISAKKSAPNTCYLVSDNWDDFSFKTLFDLYYTDFKGNPINIGNVKIMTKSLSGKVKLPSNSFEKLTEEYCSLGQGQSYYEELMSLPQNIREDILLSLRDCAYDLQIYQDFKEEEAMSTSLLRNVKESDVSRQFKSILEGNATLTSYHFTFTPDTSPESKIDVEVIPYSLPQTNVHVLIGRNGVGKTRLLSGIADGLTENSDSGSISLKGQISFIEKNDQLGFTKQSSERFTNLVTIVFSAFDQFAPISPKSVKGKIKYHYVGLKKLISKSDRALMQFKNLDELTDEFKKSLGVCLKSQRKSRWIEAIQFLSSDPIFSEYKMNEIALKDTNIEDLEHIFRILSSGHRIILLSITRLIELVEDRTLVLIDEPETHLHPPLLASYIRSISDLLSKRNGVALLATHSPVILQEVPAKCVTIIDRIRSQFRIDRPTIETFGENVGTLTREVFKLEVRESGFHKTIENYLSNHSYDEFSNTISNNIGSEARAIARVIEITKK